MRGASLFHVARKMHQRGAFTLGQAAGIAWKQLKFVLRGENLNDVHAVRDSALRLAAGITEEDIKALGEEVYDEMIASRIWPGAKALAEQHLRVGRKVWLVTATPIEVATVISTPAGADRCPRDRGRDQGRVLHRQTCRGHPARRGQSGGGPGHRGQPRTGSEALLGLQRLLQRHPAADPWWATPWPSTRTPGCAGTPANTTGRSTTSVQAAEPQRWASRPPQQEERSTASGGATPASAAPAPDAVLQQKCPPPRKAAGIYAYEVTLLLIAALVAGLTKQLAVLLLGHTLATLLNN